MVTPNSNDINLKGSDGLATNSPDPKTLQVALGTATSLGKIESLTTNNGKNVQLKGVRAPITTGRTYGKDFYSGFFEYRNGILTFISATSESGGAVVSVGGTPVSVYIGFQQYDQFKCTISGVDINYIKKVIISGGYDLTAQGSIDYSKPSDILIGGVAPESPTDDTTGIVSSGKDVFYISCLKSKISRVIIQILFADDVQAPLTDNTEIYGAGSMIESKAVVFGNMTARTPDNASDSDFFNYGIELETQVGDTDFVCFNSMETSTLNAGVFRKRKDVKLWNTDYAGFNTTLNESHVTSNCITLKAYRPTATVGTEQIPAQYTHIFKLELADGVKLGDIVGYRSGMFEATISTDKTDVLSLTIGQCLQNFVIDPSNPNAPILLPLLDFTRVPVFVGVSFVNSKEPKQLLLFRDYNGTTERNLRFNIVSELPISEIYDLDNSTIKDITVVMIKEATTTPPLLLEGYTRIGAGRYSYSVTKSTTPTTAPTFSQIIPIDNNGVCSALVPVLEGFKPVADYVAAPNIVAEIRLRSLASGNIMVIRDVTFNKNQKPVCYGEVGVDAQIPLFTTLGGDQDVRSAVMENVTAQYTLFIEVFAKATNVGADVLQAVSVNDTGNAVILNGDLDTSTSDNICDFIQNTQVPLPTLSLPMSEASLQIKDVVSDEVITFEIGGANNVRAQDGWGIADPYKFYKSTVNTLKSTVNSLIMYTDGGNHAVYGTTSPAAPTPDPNGFFEFTSFNPTLNNLIMRVLPTTVNRGYFNTHQILVSVVSAGGFYVKANIDPNTIDILNNQVAIVFYNTDGTPFDISQIVAFSVVSINISDTPITTNTLFSVGSASSTIKTTADQVAPPIITQTTFETGIGINLELDNTYVPTLYSDNLVTDSEAKYKIRFILTGTKLNQDAILILDASDSVDPTTNVPLASKYWAQTMSPNDFMSVVETTTLTVAPIYMYALVSNINSNQSFRLTKVKRFSDIDSEDIVSNQRVNAIACRCEGLAPVSFGDASIDIPTGNINNVGTYPFFYRSYSINTASRGGRNRLLSSDIRSSDDNLGYKFFNSTIYQNDRLDGSTPQINFVDRAMLVISLHIQSVDVLLTTNKYANSVGKKANAVISGTGNKTIELIKDTGTLVERPVVSAQLVLKPTAELGTNSQIVNSNIDEFSVSPNQINVIVDVESADANNVLTGYSVFSNISSVYDLLTRPVIINKTNKTRYARYNLQFQPSTDGVAQPTYTLTRISPTADADYPYKLSLATTIDSCLQRNPDGTATEVTDLTASNTKQVVVKVNVTIDAGWDFANTVRFVLLGSPNNKLTDIQAGVGFGVTNCATKDYPLLPSKDDFYLSIRNLAQETEFIMFSAVQTGGAYTNPEDNDTVFSQITSLMADNGITQQVYGWGELGSGDVYYVSTFSSMTTVAKESSLLVNDTSGAFISGGKYLGTITRSVPEIIKFDDFEIIEDRYLVDDIALAEGQYKQTLRTRYNKKEVLDILEKAKKQRESYFEKEKELFNNKLEVNNFIIKSSIIKDADIKGILDQAKARFKSITNEQQVLSSKVKRLYDVEDRYLNVLNILKKNKKNEVEIGIYIPASYLISVAGQMQLNALRHVWNTYRKPHQLIASKYKNASMKYALKRDAFFGVYGYAKQFAKSYLRYVDPFIRNYKDFKVTRPMMDLEAREHITKIMETLKYLFYYLPRRSGMFVEHDVSFDQYDDNVKSFGMPKSQCPENEYMLYIIATKMYESDNLISKYIKNSGYFGNVAITSLLLDVIILIKNKGLNIIRTLNNELDELTLRFLNALFSFDTFSESVARYEHALPKSLLNSDVQEENILNGKRSVEINLSDICSRGENPKAYYVVLEEILKGIFNDIHKVKKGKSMKEIVDEVREIAKDVAKEYNYDY